MKISTCVAFRGHVFSLSTVLEDMFLLESWKICSLLKVNYLSIYLSIYLSSVYLSIHLFIHRSLHPSVIKMQVLCKVVNNEGWYNIVDMGQRQNATLPVT